MASIDVVQTEIIRNQMVSATEEMAKTLIRTAYSPLLYEVQDFGATIMSATGQMWAETPGVIVFSTTFPQAVQSGIAHWKGDFSDGDVLIVNDPFETGTHISDTDLYMPVIVDGKLVAFCGMAAHWADVGGQAPGGWCPSTTDMFQEGLCFRHQKITAAGVKNDGLWSLIADNVRVPVTVLGDLEAQIAACRKGVERVRATCKKYGRDAVIAAMDRVISSTDVAMRAAISKLEDGVYNASIQLDSDGVSERGEFKACLKVTVKGDRVHFSTAGSSPTARGPINLPEPCTRGILASSLKGILMPFDPTNEGHGQCIDFDIPRPSVLSPTRPAPSDSYGYMVCCLMELVFRCFSRLLPDRCPSGGYQLTGAFVSRTQQDRGRPFVMAEPVHGGNGALYNSDGPTNQLVGNGDLPNTPIEILETRFPVRVDCLEYAPETAGVGKFRGGMGVRKDYRLLETDCFAAFILENTLDKTSLGTQGGGSGAAGHFVINPGPNQQEYDKRLTSVGPLEKGSVIRVTTGGGGGWGLPHERDAALVLEDVVNDFIDPERAASVYGVAVVRNDSGWAIDAGKTARLRS
ncbi:MAG: N-methylhydantoinase [Gammaproteobacteria bacterium]|nr:N-methylhydantoinase [Gammaproteobacteria bacterium]